MFLAFTLFLGSALLGNSNAHAIPFFEIKKAGQISYLLGTNHGVPGAFLPKAIRAKLESSRSVMVETLAREEDVKWETYERLKGGMDPKRDNKKLFNTLDWIRVRGLLGEIGFPAEIFRRLNPVVGISLMSHAFRIHGGAARSAGYNAFMYSLDAATDPDSRAFVAELKELVHFSKQFGVESEQEIIDDMLVRIGHEKNLPVTALDRAFEKSEREKTATDADLLHFVRKQLKSQRTPGDWQKHFTANPRLVIPLVKAHTPDYLAWTPENAETYAKGFSDLNSYDEAEMEQMRSRHTDWIPELVQEAVQGRAFIGVGMAHLEDQNGTPGLITLFKNAGFEVTFAGGCDSHFASRNH